MAESVEAYRTRGRLVSDAMNIEQYRPIIEKDNFQVDEPHWRRISKNTISLFQVLIDQDLSDLVTILEAYPQYTSWVCEHFRYAYSYSENEADIDAASRLLFLGEPYFSRQFVRNVVRKLPQTDQMTLESLHRFVKRMAVSHERWHPIITKHYYHSIMDAIDTMKLHPLQRLVMTKTIAVIALQETFEYEADDRDAVLDIPYMN